MAGLPEKSGRDPTVLGSLHHSLLAAIIITALAPFIETFEDVQVEVGVWVGVSSQCEYPAPGGPLSHVWVSIALVFVLPLALPLLHVRRRPFVCACIRLDMFSLSLSLSMSLYISLYSLRVCPRMPLQKKQRQVQS
jgi:hypothetical protein